MCAKIIVRKTDGGKTPLSQMDRNEEGIVDALSGGPGLSNTLETLGLRVGERIKLLRKLPPMKYVAGMDRIEAHPSAGRDGFEDLGNYGGEGMSVYTGQGLERI